MSPVTLQFGHGSSAVETRAFRASPIPRACFNSATALQPWKLLQSAENRPKYKASIRPRLFSRGNAMVLPPTD